MHGSPASPSKEREGLVTITLDEAGAARGGGAEAGAAGQQQAPPQQQAAAHFNDGNERRRGGGGRRWMPCLSPYTLAVLAAIMGNILEFYDFSIYGYFAPEIGKLFFPKSQPSLRAVRTFTVFAGGFLMRPLGSLILGAIGDRFGTAAALKWSILLMTVPTVVTGCLPTYKQVGAKATFALVACRLLQGLSVGGEFMGALLHTSDHSPPGRRGLYVGMVAVFGGIGSLLGSIVSVGMRHVMTEEELLRYGWRIPFLTGSIFGFLGIFLRTQTKALKGHHHHGAAASASAATRRASAANNDSSSLQQIPPTATPTPPTASPDHHGQRAQQDGGGAIELTAVATTATAPGDSGGGSGRAYPARPAALSTDGSLSGSSFLGKEPPTPAGFYKPDQAVFDIDLVEEAMHLERDTSTLRGRTTCELMKGSGWARFAMVALIACLQSSHYYTQYVWLGTYQAEIAPTKISASTSFAVSAVQHSIAIVLGPTWAYIADRVGGPRQRTLWVMGMILVGAIAAPAFFPLAANGGTGGAFAYSVIMGVLLGFVLSGNWPTWVIETLHEAPARVTVTSIAYNLGAMVGGAYPMLASALAENKVMIAPVLPTTAYAVALFLLLAYQRFSPSGVFNPLNEPDRDFPSLYHPKSVARRRAQQRQKQLERFQEQQLQLQQSQRLLAEAGAGEESVKSEETAGAGSAPVVRLAVEEEGEGDGKGIAVARA